LLQKLAAATESHFIENRRFLCRVLVMNDALHIGRAALCENPIALWL
jgi:hypothetical protein